MVFSSAIFIFYFFPIFFLLYYSLPDRFKNTLILLGSIFFYAWGAPRFIFVILGTTALDFFLVRWMDAINIKWGRRVLLVISVSLNLGILIYFKYCNFFIGNINLLMALLGAGKIQWLNVVMPIGISFYTFESLTYVFDVYRKEHKPLKRFWDYQLYIIFFPKLIAGPIIRYHDIADQIYNRFAYSNIEHRLKGMYRFFIGLGKKVLIANVMASWADQIFKMNISDIGTCNAWLGALAYTFQIYFDFSGYSDMAIGLAMMMGFRLAENFNNPYSAISITDFWRKWHISLGKWMRTYLYIPLGGNKVGNKFRHYFNLWIVFLVSGLWHGAAWGFIIWGIYHGCFLVIERMGLEKLLKRIGKASFIYTFIIVLIGWVFFRLEDWGSSVQFLERMFIYKSGTINLSRHSLIITLIAAFFSWFTLLPYGKKIQDNIYGDEYTISRHLLMTFISLALFLLSMGNILAGTFNPFIYFRF